MKQKHAAKNGVIRKSLLIVSIAFLFFIQYTITGYATEQGVVTAVSGKIRSEANTTSEVLGSVVKGSKITIYKEVTGSDGSTWYQIFVSKSVKGYLRSDLATKGTATTTTNSTNTATTNTTTTNTTNTTTTNTATMQNSIATILGSSVVVRSDAGTDAAMVVMMAKGESVAISGTKTGADGKNWYQVTFTKNSKSYTGYIRSDLVTVSAQTTQSTQDTATNVTVTPMTDTASIKGSSVRVRSTPATNGSIVVTANSGTKVSITGKTTGTDAAIWYQVKVTSSSKTYTGFVRSDLLVLGSANTTNTTNQNNTTTQQNTTTPQSGQIKGSSVRIRATADTSSAVVGVVLSGASVKIKEQTTGIDTKIWYKVTATVNNQTVEGYIRSDFVTVQETSTPAVDTAATTVTKTGTVKGVNINVRKEPVTGTLVVKVTTGQAVTVSKEQKVADGTTWSYITFSVNGVAQNGWIRSDYLVVTENTVPTVETVVTDPEEAPTNGQYAMIKGASVRIRQTAVNGIVVCQLNSGDRVKIENQATAADGLVWYQISFTYQNVAKTGFVRSDLVTLEDTVKASDDAQFEALLEQQQFPESYRGYLRALHKKYPNWKFEAKITNLNWSDVVAAESVIGKNYVSKLAAPSWKSTDTKAYDWTTNTWYTFDGGAWVAASNSIIQFYLDPRNFLDDSGIFQFETLAYEEYQTEKGIANLLAGSFMKGNLTEPDGTSMPYATVFLEAGKEAGVNPYHLAARCYQEQGTGTSGSISGKVGAYLNIFNYFHVGAFAANGNTPVVQGLIYAAGTDANFSRPWNTRTLSIKGGSKYVAQKYIAKGQNTLYFQKFNVVNASNGLYTHQYMTNLQAATSEAAKMKKAYSDLNSELVFIIPVYNNMPESACVKPDSIANPNNYLKELKVGDYALLPVFQPETETYYVTVGKDTTSINIAATPVSATASISGTGTVLLTPGQNQISIICMSQAGIKKTYKVIVTKTE